jgi:hypothetical protein
MQEGTDLVARARTAAETGAWQDAYDLLSEADRGPAALPVSELPLLASAAYATGHLDVTITVWERAHVARAQAGEIQQAAGAAVRVAMHLLFDTALMAPVRGWLARAERLLEGQAPEAPFAWLAVVRSYERLLSGDVAASRTWAARAIEVGTKCDAAAAAVGRVAAARGLILDGELREGVALLEEAGAAALSREIDPLSTGVIYCEVVCALQGLALHDLAEEWTEAMERWAQAGAIGSLRGRCRVHRAEILRLRGESEQAEREVLQACEELRPYLRRELGWPLCELGRIRLRRGDLDGAEEALLAAHESGWDANPGLALARAARGDVAGAATAIRHALEHPLDVPSKELPPNTELRRAPLLEAQVEISLAAGDLDAATRAADELDAIAVRYESKALMASAALARGRVLLHDAHAPSIDAARQRLEHAAQLWTAIGAPYETGLARIELARAHTLQGNAALAEQEGRAAQSLFDKVGASFPTHAATARSPQPPERPEATTATAKESPVFRHEGEVWLVTFAGHSVRLADRKGLRYLARLLAEPGREQHVLALVADEREPGHDSDRLNDAAIELGDSGPLLDVAAKETYRRRLSEIDDDLADAEAIGDAGRAEQARHEREFLARELSRAIGRGGRDRRAGVASERARVSVTRAIRQAMALVREHHAALAAHLEYAVRTGTYCVYVPDPHAAVRWVVTP